jgi:hypothetical protein
MSVTDLIVDVETWAVPARYSLTMVQMLINGYRPLFSNQRVEKEPSPKVCSAEEVLDTENNFHRVDS